MLSDHVQGENAENSLIKTEREVLLEVWQKQAEEREIWNKFERDRDKKPGRSEKKNN